MTAVNITCVSFAVIGAIIFFAVGSIVIALALIVLAIILGNLGAH